MRRKAAERVRFQAPARSNGCRPSRQGERAESLFLLGPKPSFLGKAERRDGACGLVDAEDVRMGSLSIWHWILVLGVALLLFGGRGKISELMGDFAKGIKSFKKGLTEEDKAETEPVKTDPKTIDHQPASASTATVTQPETRKAG
jgi:sec-independent protein translocase protein TatA